MKYAEFNNKKVEVYFKPTSGLLDVYGPNDIKTGYLKVVNGVYELYEIMLALSGDELISDNAYIFKENQVDKIFEVSMSVIIH